MTSPLIPTVDDLAADPVTHHYDDMMAPPGLTNFLGTVRVDHDLTAVSALTFPPISQGLTATGSLFVDGRLFESLGVPVTHSWRPDRVVRSAEFDSLSIVTTTICVPGETAVVVDVRVTNLGDASRTIPLALALGARVTAGSESWLGAEAPSADNLARTGGSRLEFEDQHGTACSIQGTDVAGEVRLSGVGTGSAGHEPGIGGAGRGGEVRVVLDIPQGESSRFAYVHAVGRGREAAAEVYDRVITGIPGLISSAESFWNHQLTAVFTPGNSEYSGHLPVLETTSDALRRLYWWGALGVIWFRREFEGNVLGRSYDTLMPNYWSTTTFVWDYSLSAVVHALLDPVPMKAQLNHWIASDIHTHFGTSSLTGGPVGQWYSVNDYAMTQLVNEYVRFSGDTEFLDSSPRGSESVADHVASWATAWQGLRRGSDLADYGGIDNLLECVSSYTHEVASLNAANVWCMRTAADVADLSGDGDRGSELRVEADRVVASVLDLYVPDAGYFAARQPDGSTLPVRHCYDFNVVGTTIAGDLPAEMRQQMVAFFERELQTPSWMRALSPWDPDASFSLRPDHQWNGAYPAWPADAARALVALGAPEVALDWLGGLALSTNQGPTGQGHFVEEAQPSINGGARKAPPQLPYIIDWACSSSGAWVSLVIRSIFGVEPTLDGRIAVDGCIHLLDPSAVLRNLRVGDRMVDVRADGEVVDSAGQPEYSSEPV